MVKTKANAAIRRLLQPQPDLRNAYVSDRDQCVSLTALWARWSGLMLDTAY